MKEKLFVVEGVHDEEHLKKIFPSIQTISVGGSAINEDAVNFLIQHQEKFDIMLLLDPDYPGRRIRKVLNEKLNNPKHIFIDLDDARAKNGKKVGVEHVKREVLRRHLQYEVPTDQLTAKISLTDLMTLGLTGKVESKELRKFVAKHYHLGHCNTKTLIQRLTWLKISLDDLSKVVQCIKQKNDLVKTF